MIHPASPRRILADPSGFVLVMTLLFLGLIAAGVKAIMIETKAGATSVAGLAYAAHARSVAEAGAARAVYSSITDADPLEVFEATEDHPSLWRFDGMEVLLSATAESDRIDLNAKRPELAGAVFARAELEAELRSELQDAFWAARMRGTKLPGVTALVRPCLRLSGAMRRLERAFTVLTQAAGVAPRSGADTNLDLIPFITALDKKLIDRAIDERRSPLDDRRLRHLRPYLSDRSLQYRITARVVGTGGARTERQAAISLSPRWPYAEVIGSRWLAPVVDGFCQ